MNMKESFKKERVKYKCPLCGVPDSITNRHNSVMKNGKPSGKLKWPRSETESCQKCYRKAERYMKSLNKYKKTFKVRFKS